MMALRRLVRRLPWAQRLLAGPHRLILHDAALSALLTVLSFLTA